MIYLYVCCNDTAQDRSCKHCVVQDLSTSERGYIRRKLGPDNFKWAKAALKMADKMGPISGGEIFHDCMKFSCFCGKSQSWVTLMTSLHLKEKIKGLNQIQTGQLVARMSLKSCRSRAALARKGSVTAAHLPVKQIQHPKSYQLCPCRWSHQIYCRLYATILL